MLSINFTTAEEIFCCGICHSVVALVTQPGGDLTFECENARCRKVVMFECSEALARVEDVTIELPARRQGVTAMRKAHPAAAQRKGIIQRNTWDFVTLANAFDTVHEMLGVDIYGDDEPTPEACDEAYSAFLDVLRDSGWSRKRWNWALARDARQAA